MDVEGSKPTRQSGERSIVGQSVEKKPRLDDPRERELKGWTLLELFDGLAKLDVSREEEEGYEIVSEIKKRLATPAGLQILLSEQVRPFLVAGLQSSLPSVRQLTLSQLARTAASEQGLPLLAELWPAIIKAVADDNLKVATAAVSAILAISKQPCCSDLIFEEESTLLLRNMLRGNEVLRLRVLDLFVELSVRLPESLEKSKEFLQVMTQEMSSTDLLQRINVLELLDKIAKTEHGIAYIKQSNIVTHLQSLLKEVDDPGFPLLCSGALRLLTSIARTGTELQTLMPILEAVADLLESCDESCAEAAITFLGAFGSTTEGQTTLLARKALLKSWFEHLTSTRPLLRLSCLHAFAEILTCKDHNTTQEIYNVEDKGWDGSSTGEVMRALMKFLDQPFPEIRYATFHVIQSMTGHPWGVKAIFSFPGFLEFLINRETDTTKAGKEWKYAIIESLIRSKDNQVREILDEAALDLLEGYLAEGVFYQRGEHTAMTASKSG